MGGILETCSGNLKEVDNIQRIGNSIIKEPMAKRTNTIVFMTASLRRLLAQWLFTFSGICVPPFKRIIPLKRGLAAGYFLSSPS